MKSVGYQWLIEHFRLDPLPSHCRSFISDKNIHRTIIENGGALTREEYPKSKMLEDDACGHLEFAVKNEGVNLQILKACFSRLDAGELKDHLVQKPTGRFARILWFLYEGLSGCPLDLPDLKQGNYVDLLDPEKYYTAHPLQIPRQRIRMNLPGSLHFSPLIRKTEALVQFEKKKLNEKCQEILSRYPAELISRAVHQLYLGETRSSFQIENETLSPDRERRFKALLEKADTDEYLSTEGLLSLHRQIISDPRFQSAGWRTSQVYIGPDTAVDFIPPRPEELDELMSGYLDCARRMMASDIHPVVTAAVLSFAFVYLHPFHDGNGRLHRFLIHHILSRKQFTPPGQIFPVSQVLRADLRAYKTALDLISVPLLRLLRYTQDEDGRITVDHPSADLYRFMDLTGAVEFLFQVIEKTLDQELIKALDFLQCYDQAQIGLTRLMDGLSGRDVDLFIKFCRQNGYRLAEAKRTKFFPFLTADEIARMEQMVHDAFEPSGESTRGAFSSFLRDQGGGGVQI